MKTKEEIKKEHIALLFERQKILEKLAEIEKKLKENRTELAEIITDEKYEEIERRKNK